MSEALLPSRYLMLVSLSLYQPRPGGPPMSSYGAMQHFNVPTWVTGIGE
jgi:hypothetical protein